MNGILPNYRNFPITEKKPAKYLLAFIFFTFLLPGCTKDSAPDYQSLVQSYADLMIQHGRDRYGEIESPLFASILDRDELFVPNSINGPEQVSSESWPEEMTVRLVDHTIYYLNSPVSNIAGVRNHDRSLFGSNPMRHQSLYHILYQLSELTGDNSYAKEADKAIEYFFKNTQSPVTGLLAWGDHLHWNFHTDSWHGHDYFNVGDIHELSGEWEFWDQSFRMAPDASERFAMGLWNHQVADQVSGNFSRHTRYSVHEPEKNYDFPRYGGQMIATWAEAWSRTKNPVFLEAIEVIVSRFERNRIPETGIIPAFILRTNVVWPGSNLELARCLHKSAGLLPPDLGDRLLNNAQKIDDNFLKFPHDLDQNGFVFTADTGTRQPVDGWNRNPGYTDTWQTGYGSAMSAMIANLVYRRYKQLEDGNEERSLAYRELILDAAKRYVIEQPDTSIVLWPASFANVIDLMLNAFELTHDPDWLQLAEHYAGISLELFLSDSVPLPAATNKNVHYEAITGGPDLMKALLRLSKFSG